MNDMLDTFIAKFAWYRALSINLLKEIPTECLDQKITERGLALRHQFIDLGDMQLKILELLTEEDFFNKVDRPDEEKATQEEMLEYLDICNKTFTTHIYQVTDPNKRISWFGRMDFDVDQALTFLLAHESMHHGEILSFIFVKDIPMPQALKDTWGFER